ncbi:MAG: hypothetical protein IT293_15450 [Deltaproteobacteria bacterium]|nr:hypothetical protein [Deltaproteobacteria bacterium]
MRSLPDAFVVLLLIGTGLALLDGGPAEHIFRQHFWPEFWEVLPRTLLATLKVWSFWLLAGGLLAALLLRLEPRLGRLDAAVGGAFGIWMLAYFVANLLGPVGLFRGWTVWLGLAAVAAALWRLGPPAVARRAPAPGTRLALLAFLLILPTMLLLQLGAPVPPFMDVLATPSSAQRIVTFGRYLPFDNDPYGYWDAASQCPGTELLYALVALATFTDPAVLAQSASMVPMVGLLVLGTYRLGKSIGGDVAGGMAALFLFATVLPRVVAYMHGRSVTFALVGAGLGLLLDRRRVPARQALAALLLGTAVASHAIIGFFGMFVAAGSVVFWLLAGQAGAFAAGVGLLAAASLFALPEIAIGLRAALPYPALPLAQIAAIGLAVASARALAQRPDRDFWLGRWLRWGLALAGVALLVRHAPPFEVLVVQWERLPTLYFGACAGLLAMLWLDRTRGRVQLAPVVVALLFGIGLDYVSRQWWTYFSDGKVQTAVEDFYHKIDYWLPYVLIFPTACLAAWSAERVSLRLATYAVLAILLIPWKDSHEHPDPNYHQHAIVEAWGYQLELAKCGYWGATGHRRWAQSPAELALADVLRAEVAAGRITLDTHVVQLGPYILLYQDNVVFALYTGINSDGYVAGYLFDRSIAGGRLRPAEQFLARLAERPPYVVVHEHTKNATRLFDRMAPLPSDAFREYDEIYAADGVRLYRSKSLAPAPAAAS